MAELNAYACKLEKELTCTICEEIFTNPRTLRCLHSFCLECISDWNALCRRQTQPLTCPSCRSIERLEGNDVSSLPYSFYLDSLLQLLHNMRITVDTQDQQQIPDYVNCSMQTEFDAFYPQLQYQEKHETAMVKKVSDEEEHKEQHMIMKGLTEIIRKLKAKREKQKTQNYEEQQKIENSAGPSILQGQKLLDGNATNLNEKKQQELPQRCDVFPEKPSIISSKPVAEHRNVAQSVTDPSPSSDLQRLDDISDSTRQECDDIDLSEENWWFGSITDRDAAAILLKDCPDGTFLLRNSFFYPGTYSITLSLDCKPRHIHIIQVASGCYGLTEENAIYRTLKDLVQDYHDTDTLQKHNRHLATKLVYPLRFFKKNV